MGGKVIRGGNNNAVISKYGLKGGRGAVLISGVMVKGVA